jgi:hypothetical protein
MAEVVACKLSRAVVHDEARRFGVGLVAVALWAGVSLMTVPWLMALGGVYSFWRLRLLYARTRQGPVVRPLIDVEVVEVTVIVPHV